MSTLENSLRLKAGGTSSPALVGAAPLSTPDIPVGGGQSGGIAKSKQIKNAGSSSIVVPKAAPDSDFVSRMGAPVQSDKSGGYH
jgi:hypothetical protein